MTDDLKNTEKYIEACCDEFRAQLDRAAAHMMQKDDLRFVALSGPTCSGKTTSASMLTKRLENSGKEVITVSLDDFYYDRDYLEDISSHESGPIDMDSPKTIDLEHLEKFICDIGNMRQADMPIFDFSVAKRKGYKKIMPSGRTVFLFEGIQALYPEVRSLFGSSLTSMYISVRKEISGFRPSEIRLMRRIIRDVRIRNTSPDTTLYNWGRVLENERLHIYPNGEHAELGIDSAMGFEVGVYKKHLLRLLTPLVGTEHDDYARKTLKRLESISDIPDNLVPQDSIIREFIG